MHEVVAARIMLVIIEMESNRTFRIFTLKKKCKMLSVYISLNLHYMLVTQAVHPNNLYSPRLFMKYLTNAKTGFITHYKSMSEAME